MNDIVYKLPKGIELSDSLKFDAVCGAYFKVMHFGHSFYVPVTKEMKKIFGIKFVKGKISHASFDTFQANRLLHRIIDSVYLQVRDSVCAGIEQHLEQKMKEGFARLFKKQLHKNVKAKVMMALPFKKKEARCELLKHTKQPK